MKKILTILIIFYFTVFQLFAQERGLPVIRNYSYKEYKGVPQNWAIAEDNRGLMYFGNQSGVLEYDGTHWRIISIPNQSTVRSLESDAKGRIFVGAIDQIGYLSPDSVGKMRYVSLISKLDTAYQHFGDVWDIACVGDDVFFLTDNCILQYTAQHFEIRQKQAEYFYLLFNCQNQIYVQEIGKGLQIFKNNTFELLPNSEILAGTRIHGIFNLTDNKLLLCTRNEGLLIYDSKSITNALTPITAQYPKALELNDFLIKNNLYHAIALSNGNYCFATIRKGIVVTNQNFEIQELIDNQSGLQSDLVLYLYPQNQHVIWVALDNGISRIEVGSPIRYWNDKMGVKGSVLDILRYNNKIYFATGTGVYYLENSQNIVKQNVSKIVPVSGIAEQAWNLIDFTIQNPPHKIHHLLAASSRCIYEIVENKAKILFERKDLYIIFQSRYNPNRVFLGNKDGFASIYYENGVWKDEGKWDKVKGQIREIEEDSEGTIWMSSNYKGVIRVEFPMNLLSRYNSRIDNRLDTNYIVNYYENNCGFKSIRGIVLFYYNNHIYFASETGFYHYSKSTQKFEFDTLLGKRYASIKYGIERLETDSNQNIWVDAKRIYYKNENGFTIDSMSLANIPITFAEAIFNDRNGITWFGSADGIFRFDATVKVNPNYTFNCLIRKATVDKDTIFFGTNYQTNENQCYAAIQQPKQLKPNLKYEHNSIIIHFAAPFFINDTAILYKFKLDNFNKQWSDWTSDTKKEYTNLREGKYIFRVVAKNIFGIQSEPAIYEFTVLPPWYRTYLAYISYVVLIGLTIWLIVRLNVKRLIKEKEKLEQIVVERTAEIMQQKEEIQAQADNLKEANENIIMKNMELEQQKEEITTQTEQLRFINSELEKLSFVARETDNAVSIFDKSGALEWVNEGFVRLYGYTFDEFIAERGSSIFKASNNPNINHVIKECIEGKETVIYQFFSLTRDNEGIWTQTTLTPFLDDDANVIKLIAVDSDITKMKNAEFEITYQKEQIEIQRDELQKVNATKDKFFSIIAHDLRGPLATFVTFINLVVENYESYDKEELKDNISEIGNSSTRVLNLLENLLEWSRSQRGMIKYQPQLFDIQTIVDENIELLSEIAFNKNIMLLSKVPAGVQVFADANMISTVIRNITSNAIKFTKSGGKIQITIAVAPEQVEVCIADNGVGIDPEDIDKLFRVDVHYTTLGTEKEHGTGLGLIICHEFILKNNGKIWVESQLGKGTAFRFTLPVKMGKVF